jgi:hypothetical protein
MVVSQTAVDASVEEGNAFIGGKLQHGEKDKKKVVGGSDEDL